MQKFIYFFYNFFFYYFEFLIKLIFKEAINLKGFILTFLHTNQYHLNLIKTIKFEKSIIINLKHFSYSFIVQQNTFKLLLFYLILNINYIRHI